MTHEGHERAETGSMPPSPLDDPGHGVGRITAAQFAAIQDHNLRGRRYALRGSPGKVLSVALLALLTMSAAGVTGYWNGYDVSGRQADEAFQRLDEPDHNDEDRSQMVGAIFKRVHEYLGKLHEVGGQPGYPGDQAIGYITNTGIVVIDMLKPDQETEPNPRPAARAAGLKTLSGKLR